MYHPLIKMILEPITITLKIIGCSCITKGYHTKPLFMIVYHVVTFSWALLWYSYLYPCSFLLMFMVHFILVIMFMFMIIVLYIPKHILCMKTLLTWIIRSMIVEIQMLMWNECWPVVERSDVSLFMHQSMKVAQQWRAYYGNSKGRCDSFISQQRHFGYIMGLWLIGS